jgi:hypothetical protein
MDSKLSQAQTDTRHDGDVVLAAPKDRTDAEQGLSKPAHAASNGRRSTAGPDFSAGPRMTEPSLDPTPRPPDVNDNPLPTDRPSPGRRTSRRLARFVMAVCVGVAATLSWQSYGGVTKQMIANSAPQLSWLLLPPPAMNPPSGREIAVEQPSPAVVQAAAPQPAPAPPEAVASAASETATSTAPTRELQQQLETIEQDLAAVRQNVEQLAAGQAQMARDIARLHPSGPDIRRRISALPPAATTAHKPVTPPQPAPQLSTAPLTSPPPQSTPQLSTAPLMSPPPEPAPQSSAGPLPPGPLEPPRPPMPVR